MKGIKFLPTVYITIALLASVLFLAQILSQKNLSARKALQDVTNVSAKDAPPDPKYVPGEIIVKFKHPIKGIKNKSNKDITSEFDNYGLFYSDIEETSIPVDVQEINTKYSIIKIEKVFKGAQLPAEELKKFKNNFPKRTINEQILLNNSLDSTYTISYDSGESPNTVATALETNPNIEYAEPNYIISPALMPNDMGFVFLWNLHNNGERCGYEDVDIDAPEAWDIKTDSSSVIVAVIDTGIDYSHEDLSENIWINTDEIPNNSIDDDGNGYIDDIHGWNFSENNNNPFDDNDHGTHVAGIIGAVGNNTTGIVGVNWRAKLMPLKFMNSSGSGLTDNAAAAIHYANIMGARVSNNSWGNYGGYSQTLYNAINESRSYDAIFVAAAGNGRNGVGVNTDIDPHYPSGYNLPNIISIAASDCQDNLAEYSNYGLNTVDIVAFGTGILSTTPNNSYYIFSGTSMATPHVAGAVALLLSHYPNDSADNIRYKILNNVDPMMNTVVGRIGSGGRLSVYKAIIDNTTYPTPTPLNTPTITPTPIPTYQYSFTPDVVPSPEWDTAEELLDRLTLLSGVLARDIARWDGSVWVGHVNNTPFNNFTIEVGKGYLMKFSPGIDTSVYAQLNGSGEISSSTYVVRQNAWDFIGISRNLLQSNSITDAETLCSHFGIANTPETTMKYWNVQQQDWVTHQCQTSSNNFQINSYGNSFFIYSNSEFSFTLQESTPTPTSTPTPLPSPPLFAMYDTFAATFAEPGQVVVKWSTFAEFNNLGFNLWRGTTPDRAETKLNSDMIYSCDPGGSTGCQYYWDDKLDSESGKEQDIYYYWVEDIDMYGRVTRHGPAGTDGSGGP